jgi:Holliday junction resolvase RusA-like endonuclease
MPRSITAHVTGAPAPQGSKSGFVTKSGKVNMVESSKRVKPWRKAVHEQMKAAVAEQGWATAQDACSVRITFFLPRGKSVKRDLPTVTPDLDKLVRSITTSKVYDDDYAAGALITVSAD